MSQDGPDLTKKPEAKSPVKAETSTPSKNQTRKKTETMKRKVKISNTSKDTVEEGCKLVRIPEKQRDEDLDYVVVGVNGTVYQLQCGSEVILPDRFLHALDNASQPAYKKTPDSDGRKVVTSIKKVNYSVMREASWEEFEEMKKNGALATNKS